MKLLKPPGAWLPPPLEEPLYPCVPGAEEKVGVDKLADLKEGGGPAAGGGRGGSDEWGGGVDEDADGVGGCLRPGGGGYDMMNGCTKMPFNVVIRTYLALTRRSSDCHPNAKTLLIVKQSGRS